MQVETSQKSLDEMLYQARYCPTLTDADWQEWRDTLRALLSERDAATARAEAAEREASDARMEMNRIFNRSRDRKNELVKERDAATAERDRLREALEIVAGYRQCMDNLMSNVDVARAALTNAKEPSA